MKGEPGHTGGLTPNATCSLERTAGHVDGGLIEGGRRQSRIGAFECTTLRVCCAFSSSKAQGLACDRLDWTALDWSRYWIGQRPEEERSGAERREIPAVETRRDATGRQRQRQWARAVADSDRTGLESQTKRKRQRSGGVRTRVPTEGAGDGGRRRARRRGDAGERVQVAQRTPEPLEIRFA
jgi:hypothetical protein